MSEIETTHDKPSTDLLTGAWSVERHLSPLALFDPNRTAVCAQYQLALIDDANNEARAHVLAARRHLQAAMNGKGLTATRAGDPQSTLRFLLAELDKLSRGWD